MSALVDTSTGEVAAPYQLFPDLDPETFAALREDITRDGVLHPVDVDEHGAILDGHHRAAIADELGIDCPTRVVTALSERDKLIYAARVNALRRGQLSAGERRPAVARLYVEAEVTQQVIAEVLGVSQFTVSQDLRVIGVNNPDPSRGGRPRKPEPAPTDEPETDDPRDAEREEPADGWCEREGHGWHPDGCPTDPDPTTQEASDAPVPDPETDEAPAEPAPPQPKRRALTDQFFDAAYDLTKRVEAVHRLTQDDRWTSNKEKVAAKHRNDLLEAQDLLQQVIDHLTKG